MRTFKMKLIEEGFKTQFTLKKNQKEFKNLDINACNAINNLMAVFFTASFASFSASYRIDYVIRF